MRKLRKRGAQIYWLQNYIFSKQNCVRTWIGRAYRNMPKAPRKVSQFHCGLWSGRKRRQWKCFKQIFPTVISNQHSILFPCWRDFERPSSWKFGKLIIRCFWSSWILNLLFLSRLKRFCWTARGLDMALPFPNI